MGAFLPPNHRSQHLDTGGLRQSQHLIYDLVNGLLFDLFAAVGTVGGAHPCPEQTEVIVNLRHRAHSGAGVFAGGLLVDGDGRGEAVNGVHVRLVHLPQEHSGVAGKGLHIPALPLGVDGVKRQGAFPAAGQAGDHHQLVPWNFHVDVFQVIGACAFDNNAILHSDLNSFFETGL